MKYNRPRHRVFVSCDERDDKFKARIAKMTDNSSYSRVVKSIFIDCLFTKFEVQDNGEYDQEIINKVREIDLGKASVLILLCGTNTKNNVQIDWQLRAAMEEDKPLAIVILNLPTIARKQAMRAGENEEVEFIDDLLKGDIYRSRDDYAAKFPYLPERIIDNLATSLSEKNVFSISVVDWQIVYKQPFNLKQLVALAYMRVHRRGTYYNIERPLLREVH